MATQLGRDRGPDPMAYIFILGIAMAVGGASLICYHELAEEPFIKQGICTDKYVEDGTYFMKIGKETFEVDEFYYDVLVIGEGYEVNGCKNKIENIQLYRRDSGM